MFLRWIANQFRCLSGFWGGIVGGLMEKGNLPANQRILQLLQVKDSDTVLEIGFGPGLALNQLLSTNSHCKAVGIDFSPLILAKATRRNSNFIQQKRLELLLGDFRTQNLPPDSFSKIFCVHVIYFWSDLSLVAKQLRGLLMSKGVAIFCMAHKDDIKKLAFAKTDVFNKYDIQDVVTAFTNAGFEDVKYTEASAEGKRACFIRVMK